MTDVSAGTPLPTGMSDHTLIGLLQASVDRLKTTVDTQQVSSELRDREDRRTAIMIKLAQEHVERSQESHAKIQRDLEAAKVRLHDSEYERDRLLSTVADLEAEARKAGAERESLLRDVSSQLKAEREEKTTLALSIDGLRRELATAKDAAVTAASKGELQYRELYQDHATAKARLSTQSEEVEFLTEQRSKETRLIAEREYELNRTIGSLKKTVARFETDLDAQRRSSFETITVLQCESEQLRVRVIQLESMLQATDRDGASRTQQLKEELRRMQERAELDLSTATAKEKSLQQECANLTAHLRSAQREINELADKGAEGRRADVDDRIKLHADRGTLQAKVASLERQLQETVGQARAETVSLKTDLEVARNDKVLTEQRFAMELAVKRDENAKLKDELSLAAQQLADASSTAVLECGNLRDTVAALEKEVKRLNVEIVGYKETVEKLDRHVRENYAVRVLEDELSSMKQQNVQLKNQLTHANSALANLRVEADITESSRMRTMHEQVVEAQRRVSTLERELRFARPLLGDLVDAARHANCLDAALDRDVEMFFRQFGAGGSLV